MSHNRLRLRGNPAMKTKARARLPAALPPQLPKDGTGSAEAWRLLFADVQALALVLMVSVAVDDAEEPETAALAEVAHALTSVLGREAVSA